MLNVPVRNGAQGSNTKAVILVGGPSRGTRFRPLSLDTPKVRQNDCQPVFQSIVLANDSCSRSSTSQDIQLSGTA